MTFQVVWRPPAFDAMDAIVRDNPSAVPAVAAALRDLTAKLRAGAGNLGESRDPPYRVESSTPLTLYFRPAPDERKVYVIWAHLFDHRV